jgi:hypothetical protein
MIAALGLVGLAIAAVAISAAHHYFTYTVPASKVTVIVTAGPPFCPDDYPVYVGFSNGSDRTIQRVTFRLKARLKGRSTNLASGNLYTDDYIRAPTEGTGLCYDPPLSPYHDESARVTDKTELIWSVDYVHYTFSEATP